MNLPRFSVDNSLLVNLLSIVIVVTGVMMAGNIQREAFPNIAYDVVMVQTAYPGSTPKEVEKLITIPLEEELNEVDGIEKVTSVSTEGRSVIALELDPDELNKDKVVNDIQRAVDRTEDLPSDVEDPLVEEMETRDRPVMIVPVTGEDFWEVRRTARALEEFLEELPGIARVDREDWQETEIWVEVEPEKLAQVHLSLDEVTRALRARNLNLPGGKMRIDGEQHVIRTLGEFETPEEIEQVIIRANDGGNWLKVKDVARVRYALEDNDRMNKMNGQRAVNLVVVKKEKVDTLEIAEKIQSFVEEFNEGLDNGVEVQAMEDLSLSYVRRRLGILISNLSVGVVFLTIALIFFLSVRVALLTAFSIPIAAMVTLTAMAFLGKSINLLSMFGFIIVLGMLVDDGIVVAENSFRYIQQGMDPKQAAVKGASEVLAPVSATILTTLAFFGPLMFMSGIIGKYVSIIPFVVVVALIASWVESFIILPSHIADFAVGKKNNGRRSRQQAWFKSFRRLYMRIVKMALRLRWLILAGTLVAVAATVALFFGGMKFTLLPTHGSQTFFARIEAPAGTSLEEMDRKIKPLEDALNNLPEGAISHFITELGIQRDEISDPTTRREPHLAQIQVYLPSSRFLKQTAVEVMEMVRDQTREIEGLEIDFEVMRSGPPVGKAVEVHIRGENFETLEKIAQEYKMTLEAIPGVTDVRDDFEAGRPEYQIWVDEAQARRANLTVRDIANTVRTAYDGGLATTIKRTDEEIDVLVRFPESARQDPSTVESLYVENPSGHLVPLKKVARVTQAGGVSSIKHLDRKRTVTVSADLNESKVTSGQVHQELFKKFDNIPHEYPGYSVRYGGEQEKTQESLGSLFRAFAIALIVVYVILATTFQSLLHPIPVLLAIPFAAIGVIWAFFFHGENLSFMALLGSVGLFGVVLNDSIILVTFINRARRAGYSLKRAILSSGFLRLRPVVLTTVTTVVGLSPVAYGIGGLDPFLKPAALAIVWGLLSATGLTLVMVPCVYAATEDIHRLSQRVFKKKAQS